MQKYYIDSCIWMDYFEDRSDNLRPLGEWAFQLIKKIIGEKGLIIISQNIIHELSSYYDYSELDELFGIVPKEFLLKVKPDQMQFKKAILLKAKLNIPLGDAFHAVLAKDNNALMITRDSHFCNVEGIIVRKPEDLI